MDTNNAIITNKEAQIITALRSQTLRGIKKNFHTFYKNDIQCQLFKQHTDTQEHCMTCPQLVTMMDEFTSHIRYEHIYGNITEQRDIAQLYIRLIERRDELLGEHDNHDQDDKDDEDEDDILCLPGAFQNTGPSTS